MADNGENIGGINISIDGDYSPLQAKFQAAQTEAQKAGADIADALASGAAGAGDIGEELAGQLGQIPPAADDAASGLNNFSGAAEGAGQSAEGAGSGLSKLAEDFTVLGESLIITEGLKEFGAEALNAADSVTRASIALTNITGSGDTARETIEQLVQLGASDGLSMPSLLTAATRMSQMLPPGTDVVTVLGHVADGAATMGTDIGSASDRFNMLINATSLGSRGLSAMGLSLGQVITAMEAVTGQSDITVANLSSMWKALDPGDRVTVLETALSALGGTAQQVAEQTFGGQWQQLANAWEEVMVQVGQAILPVISDLTSLIKTDIAPFIGDLVKAFNELPGPVKDAAVAVALVTAALVPAAGFLAAGAIAVNGLMEAADVAAPILATLGINIGTEGEAAAVATPENAALGESLTELGSAGEVAEGGAAAAATGLGTLLIGVTAIVAEIGFLVGAYDSMTAAQAKAKQADDDAGASATALSLKLQGLGADTTQLDLSFASQSISLNKYVDGLMALVNTYSQVHAAETGISTIDAEVAKGMQGVLSSVHDTADAYRTALAVYQQLQQSLETGVPVLGIQAATTQDVAKAYANLQTAAQAAGVTLAPLPGSMQAISDMATRMANSAGFVVSGLQEQANEQTVANSSLDLATRSYAQTIAALDLYTAQLHDVQAADDGSVASSERILTAEQNLQKAYADSQKAADALDKTVTNYADTMSTAVAAGNQTALKGLESLADTMPPLLAELTGIDGEVQKLALDVPNFGVQTLNISTGPLASLQNALAEASQKVADLAAKMADGANVGQQYEKALTQQLNAQIALDEESATLATGLQGATDSVSLATIAVADAQAKYNDLVTAWQNGMPVLQQLQSAQKALDTAQRNLNSAIGDCNPLVQAQTADQTALAASVPKATQAIGAQVTALQADAIALQTVGDAVASIESDIAKAVSSASTAGGPIGAPQGYHISYSITPNTGEFGAYSTTATYVADPATVAAQQKSQEQAMYDEGYTPQAIAKATSTPLSQVLSDLGLTAAQAGQSKSGGSGSASSGSASAGGTNNIIVSGPGPILTGSAPSAPSSGGGTVAASGGAGTSAVDGGSYPAVTAHQAVGEVWQVSSSGGVSAAQTNSVISSVVNTTISGGGTAGGTQSLTSATQAVGGAVQLLATAQEPIANSAIITAQAAAQIATAVAGLFRNVTGGTSGSTVTGGGGTGYSTGPLLQANGEPAGYIPTGNPLGTYQPPSNNPPNALPPGYNPFAPGPASTINVTVNAQGSIGMNSQQLNAQITQAVTSTLVAQLQTSGARLTR